MANRWKNTLTDRDVTDEAVYLNRRQLMAGAAAGVGLVGVGAGRARAQEDELVPTAYEDITSYNNFYEFGTGKNDPVRNAHKLVTEPWSVVIDGMVDRPGSYAFEDIMQEMTVEERIYRFRCVEAWSMVIPWNGFELADMLNLAGVQSDAKYVAFETAVQPENMIGVQKRVLDFPYVEGLRLDEAMHPLTIMATGIYGQDIPNQNGAPLRLVVPWKYGFKSIKSIVRVTLTDEQPPTSWNKANGREYGFYSNVNPNKSHPRWSQSSERVIGSGGWTRIAKRQDTLMFNGYEEEVASLYKGMDLNVFY